LLQGTYKGHEKEDEESYAEGERPSPKKKKKKKKKKTKPSDQKLSSVSFEAVGVGVFCWPAPSWLGAAFGGVDGDGLRVDPLGRPRFLTGRLGGGSDLRFCLLTGTA
jgi:septal ring factor EnvC (AmiA/AmiB activator)